MTYKKYEEDFKRKIVKLHLEGHSVAALSSTHNISHTSIYKWINNQKKSELQNEKVTLEISKENERLKKEVDILKQAMTILATK